MKDNNVKIKLVLREEDNIITEVILRANYTPVEYRSFTESELSCSDDDYLSSLWRKWETTEKISDWLEEADWIELYNDGFAPLVNKDAIDFLKG